MALHSFLMLYAVPPGNANGTNIPYIVRTYRHLLIPTFDEPANQGSKMNTQRNVVADFNPSRKLGLSCKRSPFLNQCTVCFSLFPAFIMT
jgi:hypothetical protein